MSTARPNPTLFSFGYECWGSTTETLVETIDAVERSRGFEPPVFVDARLRREVRAQGFRGAAFEKLLGAERHLWLSGLGNLAIQDGGPWRLKDPSELVLLVERAVECSRERRRVVFFCSCGQPPTRCHRHVLVAKELVATAERAGVAATVEEWPGGAPTRVACTVGAKTMRRLRECARRSLEAIEPPPTVSFPLVPDALHAAAWGTRLHAEGNGSSIDVLCGPPTATRAGWYVPILGPAPPDDGLGDRAIEEMRARCGYAPLRALTARR